MNEKENRRSLDTNIQFLLKITDERFEDLKSYVSDKMKSLEKNVQEKLYSLEKKFDNKCLSCVYRTELADKADRNWWHICNLWLAILSVWGGIATLFFYLYEHVIRK